MDPPDLTLISKFTFLGRLTKPQLSDWELQPDLTLEKTKHCSIDVLKKNAVSAFELFQKEIRRNSYKILRDPKIRLSIPGVFKNIRFYLKKAGYYEISIKDFRIEIIANLPLQNIGRSFCFDTDSAYAYLAKKRSTIPLEVYSYLSNRATKRYSSVSEENISDLIRLIYLLTDCFQPFLVALLPKNEEDSRNKIMIINCKNSFVPAVNRLLELDNLTPLQEDFLCNVFKNSSTRIYPLILQHYQSYWIKRFETQCLNPKFDIAKRIFNFYRIWCYYTPSTPHDPTVEELTCLFLKSILFDLNLVIDNKKCFEILKKVSTTKGTSFWINAIQKLALEDSETRLIEQKLFVTEGSVLKISEAWSIILDTLIISPSQFLEELLHHYEIINHPTLIRFASGPSFYHYPKYFLRLARECIDQRLRKFILEKISEVNITKYYRWEVALRMTSSFKCYDELLALSKIRKNPILEEICITQLVKVLKISLRHSIGIPQRIDPADFCKVIRNCEITKPSVKILTFDFTFFPLVTIECLKLLSEKFPNLNWINFPFDRDSPLCDYIFECDGEKIYLCSILLSSVSDYFKVLFSGNFKPANKINKIERNHFDFFKKFLFPLFMPSNNTYLQLLNEPMVEEKVKKIFQTVLSSENNPIEKCFEYLEIALFYQCTHLFNLLDRLYTFSVETWDIKYPDEQIQRIYRIKDFKIWVFKEKITAEKRNNTLYAGKYWLLKHTKLFQFFKLDQLLNYAESGQGVPPPHRIM